MTQTEAQPPPPAVADPDADLLVRFLWSFHAPCPRCGYDLHRATAPLCPECGLALKLRVVTPVPLVRTWLAMTLPLLLMAGMGMLVLMVLWSHGWPDREAVWFQTCCAYFLACIPLAGTALAARRPFMRLPRPVQVVAAVLSITSATTAILAFVTNVN